VSETQSGVRTVWASHVLFMALYFWKLSSCGNLYLLCIMSTFTEHELVYIAISVLKLISLNSYNERLCVSHGSINSAYILEM